MTELSRRILGQYQVRKTYQQKTAFIELLKTHFPNLTVEKHSFFRCRNIVIGDINNAKVVLTAHYDTCARLPFPNFIAPKNPLLTILYSVLISLFSLGISFLAGMVALFLTHNRSLFEFLVYGLYLISLILLFAGPANKHTSNDNTSGVITLCELLATLNESNRNKVAFVFFDHEESGLIGSSLFRMKHKKLMKQKLLINFDCVSDGDHILVCANKAARKSYGEHLKSAFLPNEDKSILFTKAETTYYPSDQTGFPVGVAVSCMKHNRLLGYYLDRIHTKKDTVFQKENITYICNCMLRFLKQL